MAEQGHASAEWRTLAPNRGQREALARETARAAWPRPRVRPSLATSTRVAIRMTPARSETDRKRGAATHCARVDAHRCMKRKQEELGWGGWVGRSVGRVAARPIALHGMSVRHQIALVSRAAGPAPAPL